MRSLVSALKQILIILVITFILLELVLFTIYQNYESFSNISQIKSFLRKYYISTISIIQYDPKCAQYDKELTYTLKQDCIFKNKEFNTEYRVNSLGVRDDEESLDKPEVVVLGDSFAMGWGVKQDETFSQAIENNSSLKVLNAAISSYGTAREFLMFNNIDKSNLKYVVIQYCANDYSENKSFVKGNLSLSNFSENDYQAKVKKQSQKVGRYKLFRFSTILVRNTIRSFAGKIKVEKISENRDEEYGYLLQIILELKKLIDVNTKIVLFEVNPHGNNDSLLKTTLIMLDMNP